MNKVSASFAVSGGAAADGELDLSEMTPDEMADVIDNELSPGYIQLCHQCANDISDPEADELTGFCVDGAWYEKTADGWAQEKPR